MSDAPNRPLAPAPPGFARQATAKSSSSARDKKVSTACSACKRFKRKCTGAPSPCGACQTHGDECVFDESLDKRRKVAAKRSLAELETYKELYLYLVESLRSTDPKHLETLLSLIRVDASVEELTAVLGEKIFKLRQQVRGQEDTLAILREAQMELSSGSRSLSASFHDTRHKRLMSVNLLADAPLVEVPARPWTIVTDNDRAKVVIQEMQAGNLKSEICSPLLVNMMLALACRISDYPEAYDIPNDPDSKGDHFYNEAQRLWEAEQGRNTLTNAQSLALMMNKCV